MSTARHTLREAVEFSGVGLHTGDPARVRVVPEPIGTGVRFRLAGGVVVPALAEYVVDTRRATVLGIGEATISTVEHILAALFALGIDDATIVAEGPEIPVMDGSSALFCRAFEAAGLVAAREPRATFEVDEPHVFADGDAVLVVSPARTFRLRFAVDFAPPVGAQFFDAEIDGASFVREIAEARTFGYAHEVEALLAAGLARGGTLENALVFAPDGPMTPLRWPNEVVRHKALDLVGDFALLGAWPRCDVVSMKSGHRLHARATAALRETYGPARAPQTAARGR